MITITLAVMTAVNLGLPRMWGKLAGHGINDAGFAQPVRPTSSIGG